MIYKELCLRSLRFKGLILTLVNSRDQVTQTLLYPEKIDIAGSRSGFFLQEQHQVYIREKFRIEHYV